MRQGKHRSRQHRRQPYAWLAAGAVTLGTGAALVSGSAVAYADTGAGAGASKASSSSSQSSSTAGDSTSAKKATSHSARPTAATSPRVNTSSRKPSATARSTRHVAAAANATPSNTSWLPSTPPVVADVAVGLAQGYIAQAQSELQQQTWGVGNVPAGLVSVVPQMLLTQAALALNTWQATITPAQSLYARTSGVPIVHELAGVSLLGALLLPTLATTALSSAGLFLPLVGAFGASDITSVQNHIRTAAQNGRVYALVPVTMRSTTEPIVYISVNGGPSTPVLVDSGSSGLVLTAASVGDAVPLGAPTGTGTSGYSGGLSYSYTTYTTTVNFGNGIVSGPTNVNIVDADDATAALSFFHKLGGASGVLGIAANAAGPGPVGIPTTALPGDLSQGVFLYQGLLLGIAGVMVFGPNPLPTRTSVSGAADAYLNVKINNGTPTTVGAIIDSGGVYGTILSSMVGGSGSVPVGTRISVYTPDGVLLYSYIVTSQNRPTVITSGLINTGYAPFQHGPVYLDYTTPDGMGSTNFDYA